MVSPDKPQLRKWEVCLAAVDGFVPNTTVQAHSYHVDERGLLHFYRIDTITPTGVDSATVLCVAPGLWRYFKLVEEVQSHE